MIATTSWRRLLALGCILVLTLLFFHQLAFSGKILARGDTYQYFYPYWDARNEAFRAGNLPMWTPNLFMGVPLLANPQLGTYYPPNWLTAPFRAPTAISLSIMLHVTLAAAGTVFLYRQVVSKQWIPAFVAGVAFAFGGAVSSHVEQINQLQGLAWMPVLFALYHRMLNGERARRDGLLLAMAWALQVFSGHTQTVFISGVGLAVYGLAFYATRSGRRSALWRLPLALLPLAACFALALILALPQLLPSLELLTQSNRSGGFSLQEATAFSLPPSMLGRALLPSYDGQLFGEYVATLGIVGLGLALWGMASLRANDRQRRIWLALAAVGFALALGRYNPIYLLLAEAPGFNLFRVPARFLALFSLAMALLAGMGVEALSQPIRRWRPLVLISGAIALLIGVTYAMLPGDPRLIFGGATISDGSLALWIGAWLLLTALLVIGRRWTKLAAAILLTAELFLAAQNLPYNDLAPSEVYLGQRLTISQLLAFQNDEVIPGRMFSSSQIFFDPGDISDLRRRYDALGLDAAAQFHALDAVKMQLTLMPNLPLTWGIPSIDGFGGGITPSYQFSLFASLLLPADEPLAVDGRLGERMAVPNCHGACLPDRRWLEATDTRYVITDKVYDIQHDDIAYDTALARYWADVSALEPLPDYVDQVRILHRVPLDIDLPAQELEGGYLLTIADSAELPAILRASEHFLALTAVNSGHLQVFEEIQPPPFERALSSSIKIYRLPATGKRAFLAAETRVVPDGPRGDEAALQLLREGVPVVIHGGLQGQTAELDGSESVEVMSYEGDRITLSVHSPAATMLVLGEAWYPGWQAQVNGEPTPISRANLIFRALPVPAGDSAVSLVFEPQLWRSALYIGIGLWLFTLVALAFCRSDMIRRIRLRSGTEVEL